MSEKSELTVLRRPAVERMTDLSKNTIYRLVSAGRFPDPVVLNTRAIGWIRQEVQGWIAARMSARQGGRHG